MRTISARGDCFIVSFKYDAELVYAVKQLKHRKWLSASKEWQVCTQTQDDLVELKDFAEKYGFEWSEEATELFGKLSNSLEEAKKEIKGDTELNRFYITFDYDADIVSALKDRLSRKARSWDSTNKWWVFTPRSEKDLITLTDFAKDYDFTLTDEAQHVIETAKVSFSSAKAERKRLMEMSAKAVSNIEIPNIKEGLDLFPFQKAGVEYAEKQGGRVLIADEMGLGKTIQAIGYLALHPELRPAVIVCPAFLKENWKREVEKWLDTGDKICVLKGKSGEIEDADIYIINYDIISARKEQVIEMKPKAFIFDEAHYLKNGKAKRTKAVQEIIDKANPTGVIALTGTPVMNRPIELWSIINLVKAGSFGGFWDYAYRYCNAHKTTYGWDMTGASNLDELHVKLRQQMMIRRLKKDVLAELPEKQRIPVYLDLNGDLKEYNKAYKNLYKYLAEKYSEERAKASERAELLTLINELRKLVAKAKIRATTEWLSNFLDSTEEKVVVFTHHKFMVESLANAVKELGYEPLTIVGGMSDKARQEAVDSFQNDPSKRVIVATTGSAGVGLTLTASHTAVFVEFEWRPADMLQAEDRVHRIGQNEQVQIYYLVAKGTIDETFLNTLNRKMKIALASLDGLAEDDENGVLIDVLKDMGIETEDTENPLDETPSENSQVGEIGA